MIWPNLGAPDRFTGEDARVMHRGVQQEISELREQNHEMQRRIDLFSVVGPEQVRANQEAIIVTLKETISLLREMQIAQLKHFADEHGK